MEWVILIVLWTWKCGEDLKREAEKRELEEEKFDRWLEKDQEEFMKSLEGMTPEQRIQAHEVRGKAIAAAVACAACACF
jgi:hypothetical protein